MLGEKNEETKNFFPGEKNDPQQLDENIQNFTLVISKINEFPDNIS